VRRPKPTSAASWRWTPSKLALSSNFKRNAAHAFYDSLGFQRHGYSFLVDLDDDGERTADEEQR
jgi:hypothetical protein